MHHKVVKRVVVALAGLLVVAILAFAIIVSI